MPVTAALRAFVLCFTLLALVPGPAPGQETASGPSVDFVGPSETRTASVSISGAQGAEADLLRSERTGRDFHAVILGLPTDKTVLVELGFAELDPIGPGERVFDIFINNKRALSGFDIVAAAGGPHRAYVRKFTITPRRGFLDIHFRAVRGEAKMGFIRVSGPGIEFTTSALPPQEAEEVAASDRADIDPETGEILVDGARRAWPSAVPFGSLGTGKFEILANGEFSNFTLTNSWDNPLPTAGGTFLAIAAKASSGGGMARMLRVNDPGSRTASWQGVRHVGSATYRGHFPFAEWSFSDDKLPFEVRVEGFSPLVPHGGPDASLPVAYLNVEVKNPRSFPIQAAVALSWEDITGRGGSPLQGDQFGTARNLVHSDAASSNVVGIVMDAQDNADGRRSTFLGTTFIGVETTATLVVTRTLHWDPRGSSIPWWKRFATIGRLERRPKEAASRTVPTEGKRSSAVVVCATFHLAPKEVRRVPFIIAWHYPRIVTVGTDGSGGSQVLEQDYASRFASAVGVAAYASENYSRLSAATREWHDLVMESNVSGWLKTHALNSLFPMASNSVLLGGGLFSMLESPVDLRGMLGGADTRLASNGFLASMFPELDATELELFARAQVSDGRIPRYVGNLHGGYTDLDPRLLGGQWSDATSAWILQVASRYQSTGEKEFVGRVWPAVTRAVDYLTSLDRDGNGTPDAATSLEDAAPGGSPASYGTGLYAAALRAAALLANSQGDTARAAAWRESAARAEAAAAAMAASLTDSATTATCAAALAGDWAARSAALPSPLPDEAAASAVRALLSRHVAPFTGPALPLEAPPAGSPLPSGAASLPALTESFLGAAALRLGAADQGLDVFLRGYRVAFDTARNAWHQARRFSAPSGTRSRQRQHRSASAAWNALPALAGFALDLPSGRLFLDPQVPTELEGRLHVPLFTPRFWAWLDYDGSASTGTLTIVKTFDGETMAGPVTIGRVARRLQHDGTAVGETVLDPPVEFAEGAAFHLDFANNRLALSEILPPEPEIEETTETLALDAPTTATDGLTTAAEVPPAEAESEASPETEVPYDPARDMTIPVTPRFTTETEALEEEHLPEAAPDLRRR